MIRRSGEIAIRDRGACGGLDLEEVGAGPYKEVFLAMYMETYNNNKSARLERCGVTVLDIGLKSCV